MGWNFNSVNNRHCYKAAVQKSGHRFRSLNEQASRDSSQMKAREEPGSKGNPRFWAWDYKWLRFTDVKSSQTVQKVWKDGIEHILNKAAFILYRVHLNWTLVCFSHYCGFIRQVRTQNLWVWTKTTGESESVRARRSWSAFIQTLALFNCRDETIRLWIDTTAGNEPNLPFVGSSSWVKNL